MTTVLVGGVIANKWLNGGNAAVVLNWVRGLSRLGFRVFLAEQIDRASCVDAAGAEVPFEECVNRAYFRRITAQAGLSGAAALIYEGGEQVDGLAYRELIAVAEVADALVNITGHLTLPSLKRPARRRVYVDLDPGYTQVWHAAGIPGPRLDGHDIYFTIGENIGTPSCPIPTGGIPWRQTRQPVVLDDWPWADEGDPGRFTTVASWRGSYGRVSYGGRTFGSKAHEFRKVVELPRRAAQTFEIALDIHPADAKDLTLLRRHGWRIADPRRTVPDPRAYRRYVGASGAEFSVAQGIYVETGSGWLSDRTACYLASGRPALVQDTGVGRTYPVGEGLVTFRTLEEAVLGAERIGRDYHRHRRAARALAESYLDSDAVLSRFMDEIDATASRPVGKAGR